MKHKFICFEAQVGTGEESKTCSTILLSCSTVSPQRVRVPLVNQSCDCVLRNMDLWREKNVFIKYCDCILILLDVNEFNTEISNFNRSTNFVIENLK